MIHPVLAVSTSVGNNIRINTALKEPNKKDRVGDTNKKRIAALDVSSEELPEITQNSIFEEGKMLRLIQYGLLLESKYLEELSSVSIGRENGKIKEKLLLDIANCKGLAYDANGKKNRWSTGKENTVNESQWRGNSSNINKATENKHTSVNKENATAIGEKEKLLIRLPFVDWKATLVKARSNLHIDPTFKNRAIERVVSKIVNGWLLVLAHLTSCESSIIYNNESGTNQCISKASNSCTSGGSTTRLDRSEMELSTSRFPTSAPLSSIAFSFATSCRSQIYRRLLLLLLGFVGSARHSQVKKSNHSSIDKETTYAAMTSETIRKIVEHTRELARKILKEEGSTMKKKKTLIVNTDNNFSRPSFLSISEAQSMTEINSTYSYCLFTAIAAECGEHLGDLDTASLAYKSIRAIQERQRLNDASHVGNKSLVNIYSDWDQRLEGTKNKAGTEDYGLGKCTSLATFTKSDEPSEAIGSPKMNITKTPANTPNATARKKHAGGDGTSGKDYFSSENQPIGISRNMKPLFSSFPSTANARVLTFRDSDLGRDKTGLVKTDRSSIDSKIGNDLVPSGTLEERIRRCSSQY